MMVKSVVNDRNNYYLEGNMNKIIITGCLLILSVLGSYGFAQDKPKMQHSMQGQMKMSEEQRDIHLRSMQAHMLMMHDYSNKILSEKNSKKKQILKDEQFELMKAHHIQMKAHREKMMKMHQNMMK